MDATPGPFAILGADIATMTDQGLLGDAAVVVAGARIAWVGPRTDLPGPWRTAPRIDAAGALLTPGLVECHTQPAPDATADGDPGAIALDRAHALVRRGATTLEIKVGPGADGAGVVRLLGLADRIAAGLGVTTRTTFRAADGYPPGVGEDDREEWVISVCDELLPAAAEAGGYDAVEVYCDDEDGLSMEDASTILETVYRRKVPTRVAADRLSDSAGGSLAPAFYAKAAIHLDHTDDIAVKAMASAGTTAVLVPDPALESQDPPVALLRELGVPMAVSGGVAEGYDVGALAAAAAAVDRFGLSTGEALAGVTRWAARALALPGGTGTVAVDAPADLALWDAATPEEMLGGVRLRGLWSAGRELDLAALR